MGTYYAYLRALEIEGRHPTDAGIWPITAKRLDAGEGTPSPNSPWFGVDFPEGTPFPPTRRPPPEVLRPNRWFYYRRIRSAEDADRYLWVHSPRLSLGVATYLSRGWINPTGGVLPLPTSDESVLSPTHFVGLIGRDPGTRLFPIRNVNWPNWGNAGHGFMPYEYFDRYVFECWGDYPTPATLRVFRQQPAGGAGLTRWSGLDESDNRIYGFDVRDARDDDRLAWAFVIERDGGLEVEELYVRPEFRRRGHGHWLADRVAELGRAKNLPLRLWVPFADCRQENPDNYPGLVAVARRLGVRFQTPRSIWAAYFATNEGSGSELPVEPASIPARPRATFADLLRTAGVALAVGGTPNGEHAAANGVPVVAAAEDRPEIGGIEWEQLTRRRAELIYKKNREGLTADERTEFEYLQQRSRTAVGRAFPRARLDPAELAAIKNASGPGEGDAEQ